MRTPLRYLPFIAIVLGVCAAACAAGRARGASPPGRRPRLAGRVARRPAPWRLVGGATRRTAL